MELPAAPVPETTRVQSSGFFPATLSAFMIAAVTTIAVPCWSSWNTGMFSSFIRVRSTSTHLGAEISSRFIPPNVGAICLQNSIIFFGSFVSIQSGTASTPANFLKTQSAGTLRSESEIRGTLRLLPQLEMRPSSNAPNPVESREAPPTSSFPDFSEPP